MSLAYKQPSFEIKCGKQLSLIRDLKANAPNVVQKCVF
jgi:hypothetical protein